MGPFMHLAGARKAKAELKGDLPPSRHERLDRLIPFENNEGET